MTVRLFLLAFSILGISATFMPWIHYPKANKVFYGYMGDGLITGFIFTLLLIFSIYTFRQKQFKSVLSYISAALGLLMAYTSFTAVSDMESEKLHFKVDNPVVAAASAGFYQGIGIYYVGIAGLGVFASILFGILFQKYQAANSEVTNSSLQPSNPAGIALFIILFIGIIVSVLIFSNKESIPTQETIRSGINEEISKMGKALASEDYNTFINYNHPTMIQSYGGRENIVDLLRSSMLELKNAGTTVKKVDLKDIYDIEKEGNMIQALLTQEITYSKNGQDKKEIQKMIAVSENDGKNWYFINISGKNKSDIKKVFPALNKKLDF